jgi:heterodisulfide reductase subunit A
VVDAMAAGRSAATAIDAYLHEVRASFDDEPHVRKFTELEIFKIKRTVELARRTGMTELPLAGRTGFAEVAVGYTLEQARTEAHRCLAGMGEGCIGCHECVRRCAAKAVDHDMTEQVVELDVGAVLLSGGFECYDSTELYDLGYKRLPNVVTSLEFERILSATGPFEGALRRPSDLKAPRRVAFLQCVGSRDAKHHRPYCSSVCCTYAIKEAMIAKEHSPVPVDIDIFMMDLRTYGKDFERYYERARVDSGVNFIRAKAFSVSAVEGTGELSVSYGDASGHQTAEYDMVVLSQGFQPSPGLVTLAKKIGVQLNQYGFCQTVPFSPMETSRPGIYTCGAFSAPRDIPETVTQASGAAGDISALLGAARNTLVKPKEYPPERDVSTEEPRIGVFICHCGINIGGYVNVSEVAEYAKLQPNVLHAECNLFTCSQDTQERIKSSISQHGLNRVIVASCSPRTHERLFQETLRESGLNPYLFEMANIRDQCSWVHMHEGKLATAKAKDLVGMAIAKARLIAPLTPLSVSVNHAAVVVGGGVAGMTSALELADQGVDVHLIERTSQLGGLARRILYSIEKGSVTEFIAGIVRRVNEHPHITVHSNTWIVDVNGYVGNFGVDVMRYRAKGMERLNSGVIIVATGAQEYRPKEYFYGRDTRVLTQLELAEEMDKQNPDIVTSRNIVMIQCVGSRNEEHPYCSRVCCNQSIKNALKLKELNPQVNIYVLFRDMRTYGFFEEYYQEARRVGIVFLRYEAGHEPVVTHEKRNGDLLVRVETDDPILGTRIAIYPDFLALSAGIVPVPEARELAMACKVPLNQDGFFLEAHVKLRPVDFATDGIFVCGTAHAPKSIEESIAQAKAAAARATTILVKDTLAGTATVCTVDERYCAGCGICQAVCPYGAVAVDPERKVSVVNEALCKGCGTCAASCPAGACRQRGFRSDQISAMLAAALEET